MTVAETVSETEACPVLTLVMTQESYTVLFNFVIPNIQAGQPCETVVGLVLVCHKFRSDLLNAPVPWWKNAETMPTRWEM